MPGAMMAEQSLSFLRRLAGATLGLRPSCIAFAQQVRIAPTAVVLIASLHSTRPATFMAQQPEEAQETAERSLSFLPVRTAGPRVCFITFVQSARIPIVWTDSRPKPV